MLPELKQAQACAISGHLDDIDIVALLEIAEESPDEDEREAALQFADLAIPDVRPDSRPPSWMLSELGKSIYYGAD